jgi:Txe/YoeB family toxin of toxin-antitoxin system
MYKIILTKHAEKDAKALEHEHLKPKALALLKVINKNPYENPPEYEKLHGYKDTYSRRINRHHRIVYHVMPNDEKITDKQGNVFKGLLKVLRMWTHYE